MAGDALWVELCPRERRILNFVFPLKKEDKFVEEFTKD
jgi:hypothetical protein